MWSKFLLLASVASISYAQDIDFEGVKAAANPTYTIIPGLRSQVIQYDEAAATSSVKAEALATPLPDSGNPEKRSVKIRGSSNARLESRSACDRMLTTPNVYNATLDPAEAFLADQNLADVALNAVTPPGYARNFQNLQASSQANGYMGYQMLNSYDPSVCAQHCNTTSNCAGFNIFIERNPTVEPGFQTCQDPPAFGNIVCTYWGGPQSESTATNNGQWRANFHVVIAASNGYTLQGTPSVFGYTPANPLQSRAINAPLDCNGRGSYMGYRLFNDGGPFDPNLCAAACAAQNEYALAHPPPDRAPDLCKFWDTYILAMNGVNQGQYCSMYTQFWDPNIYGTNDGQYDGQGNHFTIQYSFTYYNVSDTGLPICPADISTLQSSAGPFCTSYISYAAPTSTVTISTTRTVASACPTVYNKRDGNNSTDFDPIANINVVYESKSAHPSSGVAPTSFTSFYTDAPTVTGSPTAHAKRTVATPALLATHSAWEISSACSRIATGTVTTTTTSTATVTTPAACGGAYTCDGASPTNYVLAGSYSSSPSNYDDNVYQISVPFPIGLYGTTSQNIYVSNNGLVGINYATGAYGNGGLPQGSAAVAYAYWDDLYIFSGYAHYVSAHVCGSVGHRTITFEWNVGHYGSSGNGPQYHFTATFYEASPNVVQFHYIFTSDLGSSATIGVQGANGAAYQYSLNSQSVPNGRTLTFDTSGSGTARVSVS